MSLESHFVNGFGTDGDEIKVRFGREGIKEEGNNLYSVDAGSIRDGTIDLRGDRDGTNERLVWETWTSSTSNSFVSISIVMASLNRFRCRPVRQHFFPALFPR